MTNFTDRIDGMIGRAAARYCRTFTITTSAGDVIPITAVRRVVGADEVDSGAMNVAISSRLYEFVLAPSSVDALLRMISGSGSGSGSGSDATPPDRLNLNVDALRKLVVKEYDGDVQVAEYRINSARPFLDNDPSGGSLRLYAYMIKG